MRSDKDKADSLADFFANIGNKKSNTKTPLNQIIEENQLYNEIEELPSVINEYFSMNELSKSLDCGKISTPGQAVGRKLGSVILISDNRVHIKFKYVYLVKAKVRQEQSEIKRNACSF